MNERAENASTPYMEKHPQPLTTTKRRKIWIWSAIIVIAICFLVIKFEPFSSDARAIENVIKEDAKTQLDLPQDNRQALRLIVTRMRAIDTSDCPGDFRAAYERHIHAWEGMRDQILSEPEGFLDSFFVGFLHGLAGDLTGGTADMAAAENYWLGQIRDTWNDVRAIAMKHNAKID